MIAQKYYSPDGDGGGISATETGSADTGAAEAATASATPDNGGEAGTSDSVAATPAATPDFRDIHERALKGEQVPDEHLDAYERWVASGMPDAEAATPEEEQPTEETKPAELPEWQASIMKFCGAKTPEELPDKFKGLLKENSSKGERIKELERLAALSQLPAAQAATQPQTQPAAQNEYNKDMFFDPEEGEKFLGEFGKLKAELAELKEMKSFFDTEREAAKQRAVQAKLDGHRSRFVDELLEVAELYHEFYEDLRNVPVRSLLEQYIDNPGNPDPRLKSLLETAKAYNEGKGNNMKEAHILLHFDELKGKIAQAKIEAGKAATSRAAGVKPTVGVAAVAQHKAIAPNPSDKELEAYRDGNMDMPEEWFDDEGDPTDRMPQKLKAMLGYQAA